MTRRELLNTPVLALAGIPFIGNILRTKSKVYKTSIIRTLPFALFPGYKPGDNVLWYEYPYWNIKLTGRVESVRLEGSYKYIVVRVDERSKRKLTNKTRFPVWAMQEQPRFTNPQATYTPLP